MRQSAPLLDLSPAHRAVLDADGWFGALPQARRELLLGEARRVRLEDAGRFYGVGDPPNGLWAVLEGQVRLLAYPVSGAELLIRILGPGVWCGELSTIDQGPRPHDAVAHGPVVALHVSAPAFANLAEREPALWRDIALLGCIHQREALGFIGRQMTRGVRERLARTLLDAVRNAGTASPEVRQDELAGLVGVGRQTLNRHLKQLEALGVARAGYGRVEVIDTAALERLAGPEN